MSVVHSRILLVLGEAVLSTPQGALTSFRECWRSPFSPKSLQSCQLMTVPKEMRRGQGVPGVCKCAALIIARASWPVFQVSIPQQERHLWLWWTHHLGPWAAHRLMGIKSSDTQGYPTAFLFWCLLLASYGKLQNRRNGDYEGMENMALIPNFLLKEALSKYTSAFREENILRFSLSFSVFLTRCCHQQPAPHCLPRQQHFPMDLLSNVLSQIIHWWWQRTHILAHHILFP